MSQLIQMFRPVLSVETFMNLARGRGQQVWVHALNKGGFNEIMESGKLLATEGVSGWGGLPKARAVSIEDALKTGDNRYPRLYDATRDQEVIVFTTKQKPQISPAQASWYEDIMFDHALGLKKNGEEVLKQYSKD